MAHPIPEKTVIVSKYNTEISVPFSRFEAPQYAFDPNLTGIHRPHLDGCMLPAVAQDAKMDVLLGGKQVLITLPRS